MGRPTDPNFWQQSPPPQTGDMNNERTLNQRFMRELPGALPPQDVIIHDGAISGFESAALIVDTEGEAAADELNVINIVLSANENLHPGMIITLRAKDQARTVTVKNSAAANGINTAGGHDVVLSTEWDLVLRLVAGRWYEIQTRGDVRASDAQTDASTALARTAPATTTSRGIGRVATLADMEPGALVENGPAVIDATGGVITTTPTAHAVPQADADGSLNNWAGARYATCATASATAAKVVALANFVLKTGSRIFVTFSNANTVANSITLNVNSTGDIAVYNETGAVSASNLAYLPAGRAIEFIYDGAHWVYQAAKVSSLGTRSTTGTWTLTGCAVGRPIYITFDTAAWSSQTYAGLSIVSGASGGNWGGTTNATITLGRWDDDWRSASSTCIIPTSTTVVINVQGLGGNSPRLTAWQ